MVFPPRDYVPAPCAEFPNDNPALHDGAIWASLSHVGEPRAIVRPRALATVSEVPAAPRWRAAAGPVLAPPRPARSPELRAKPGSVRPPTAPTLAIAPTPPTLAPRSFSYEPVPLAEDVAEILHLWLAPPAPASRDVFAYEPEPLPEEAAEVLALWLTPPIPSVRRIDTPPLDLVGFEATPVPPSVLATAGPPEDVVLDALELTPLPRSEVSATPVPSAGERDGVEESADELTPVPRSDVMVILEPIAEGRSSAADPLDDLDEGWTREAAADEQVTDERVADEAATAEMLAGEQAAADVASDETADTDGAADEAGADESTSDEAPEPDAYQAFLDALVAVALAAGSTRAAAVLPGFLRDGAVSLAAADDALTTTLSEAGLATRAGSMLSASEAMREVAFAWRGVLTGESDDFSKCGMSTLDEWAASVLRAFGVARGDLRRELRGHGVAAFGMLVAA